MTSVKSKSPGLFVKTHLDLKDQVTKKRISESAIDKVWDRHKAAAPYIYAFYPRLFSVSNCKETRYGSESGDRCSLG